MDISKCTVCPRKCKIDRAHKIGFCMQGNQLKIARADLHFWEEPCISGTNGSGAVFFSGCSLRCIYCQNHSISSENKGYNITVERLAEIMLELKNKGAHNINLVNPTHFVPMIINALDLVKDKLDIPIVYNSSGYEKTETLEELRGYVDIFLPDLKYIDSALSDKLSHAPDYFEYATSAIKKMIEITGKPVFDSNLLKKGTIIRHLVLPGFRQNSIDVINWLTDNLNSDDYLLSIMSQYTPISHSFDIKSLNRRLSTFEYNSVLHSIDESKFKGYFQDFSSSDVKYIPEFFDKDKN